MSVTISELEVFLDFVRQEVQAGWNQFSLQFFARIWQQSQANVLQLDSFLNLHSHPKVAKQRIYLNGLARLQNVLAFQPKTDK